MADLAARKQAVEVARRIVKFGNPWVRREANAGTNYDAVDPCKSNGPDSDTAPVTTNDPTQITIRKKVSE